MIGTAGGTRARHAYTVGAGLGLPPFGMWHPTPDEGVIPPYRTDAGIFLIAEVYGCKQLIYVKDEDGLYTANPKTDKNAS